MLRAPAIARAFCSAPVLSEIFNIDRFGRSLKMGISAVDISLISVEKLAWPEKS